MTADNGPADEGAQMDRLTRLEATVEALVSKMHGGSQAVVEKRLDADSSVAAEVQRELARRDETAKQAERDAKLGLLEASVKSLAEKAPEAPARKIEQVMGWHR